MKMIYESFPQLIPCPTCDSLPLYDRSVVNGELYVWVKCPTCKRKTKCYDGLNAYRDSANEWNRGDPY